MFKPFQAQTATEERLDGGTFQIKMENAHMCSQSAGSLHEKSNGSVLDFSAEMAYILLRKY